MGLSLNDDLLCRYVVYPRPFATGLATRRAEASRVGPPANHSRLLVFNPP